MGPSAVAPAGVGRDRSGIPRGPDALAGRPTRDQAKGLIRPFTLLLLASGPLHGYELKHRLQQLGLPAVSGIYRVLHRLEAEGHVTRSPSATGSGPDRHVCQLTASGQEELRREADELERSLTLLHSYAVDYEEIAGRHGSPRDDNTPSTSAVAHGKEAARSSGSGAGGAGQGHWGTGRGEDPHPEIPATERLHRTGIWTLQGLALLTGGKRGTRPGDAGRIDPPPAPLPRHTERAATPARRRSPRDEEIVEARQGGDTLREIAARYDITPARVRQILVRAGVTNVGASKAARATREQALPSAHLQEALGAFRTGVPLDRLAKELGLSRRALNALLETHATPEDQFLRRLVFSKEVRRQGVLGYSDAEVTAAVRQATKGLGRVPSSKVYGGIAKGLGLPSLSTVENRFGSWNGAVRAAGLKPSTEAQRNYRRGWTDQQCLEAIGALAEELGHFPTRAEYDALSMGRSDLPSGTTVARRFGSWPQLALQVFDRSERAGPAESR